MADPDVPLHLRTMSLARTLLPRNRLKVGLDPFCAATRDKKAGEYAFCDGNADTVAWEKPIVCFEMDGPQDLAPCTEPGAVLVFSPVGDGAGLPAIRCGLWWKKPAGCSGFRCSCRIWRTTSKPNKN